jgi:hypothetical protein
MSDIKMSVDDTLELDTIIEKSTQAEDIISVTKGTDYDTSGFQTHTSVFNPQSSGDYTINVNGQNLSIKVTGTRTIIDDFEDGEVSEWTHTNNGGISIETNNIYEGAYSANGGGGSRSYLDKYSISRGEKLEFYWYPANDSQVGFMMSDKNTNGIFNHRNLYQLENNEDNDNDLNLYSVVDNSNTVLDQRSNISTNDWWKVTVNFPKSDGIDVTVSNTQTSDEYTLSSNNSDHNSGTAIGIGSSGSGFTGYDKIRRL